MNHGTAETNASTTTALHPAAARLFADMQAQKFPGWAYMTLSDARAALSALRPLAGEPEPVSRVEDVQIPGESQIPARVYVPHADQPMPVLVHFHAGGWIAGDYQDIDTPVRALVNATRCAVVSVNYRLAPEHKFPAALEDAYAAVRWASSNGSKFGWDGSRLGVSGDSSGGNLAAAVSLMARDNSGPVIRFQLLIYPVLDSNYGTESYRQFGATFPTRTDMLWFHCNYVRHPDELDSSYVSPLRAPDLSGLPEAFIVLPEADPLRDEGLLYAERLRQAGVCAEARVYPGMIHGFWQFGALFEEARIATADAARAIQLVFS
jgi:acetyl esterase